MTASLPGVEIVERSELDYLTMEGLAERTIAREALDRAKDPDKGYLPCAPAAPAYWPLRRRENIAKRRHERPSGQPLG